MSSCGDRAVAAVAGHEVDDARRPPRLLQQLQEAVVGQQRGARRLPQHHIAHHGRRGGQVAVDGVEVEGRHRQHEAFEWPPVETVELARRLVGLLVVEEALKRQKSTSSARSISASKGVFDRLTMMAAMCSRRRGPASRSAVRWHQSRAAQAACACSAASTARLSSAAVARWARARRRRCSCGQRTPHRCPLRTACPPMIRGISSAPRLSASSCCRSASRAGVPGA